MEARSFGVETGIGSPAAACMSYVCDRRERGVLERKGDPPCWFEALGMSASCMYDWEVFLLRKTVNISKLSTLAGDLRCWEVLEALTLIGFGHYTSPSMYPPPARYAPCISSFSPAPSPSPSLPQQRSNSGEGVAMADGISPLSSYLFVPSINVGPNLSPHRFPAPAASPPSSFPLSPLLPPSSTPSPHPSPSPTATTPSCTRIPGSPAGPPSATTASAAPRPVSRAARSSPRPL